MLLLLRTNCLKIVDYVVECLAELVKRASHAFNLKGSGKFGKPDRFEKASQIAIGLIYKFEEGVYLQKDEDSN